MSDKVLAKVAGREITEAEFHAYLQGIPREQQAYAMNPQYRDQYLDQLIALHMFAQLGEDEKLDESEEYAKILESAKRDILAQLAMRDTLKKVQVSEEELKDYFSEFHPYEGQCRFLGCTHTHEPDCKVKEALENGQINSVRYENYLQMYEELKEWEKRKYN